jgi:hypothetical protein
MLINPDHYRVVAAELRLNLTGSVSRPAQIAIAGTLPGALAFGRALRSHFHLC